MNNTIIITEGKFDSLVLSKILNYFNPEFQYKIFSAEGYSSALSKAKSYLSLNKKVLLVTDSDSFIDTEINERRQFIESYINVKNKQLFKSVLMIPEFEVVFLNNEVFVKKYLNLYLENHLLETLKYSPRKTLENHLKIRREKLLDMMSEDIISAFKSDKYILEVQNFINNT